MKHLILLVTALGLFGCQRHDGDATPLSFTGAAVNYHEIGNNPIFTNVQAQVETSLINVNGHIIGLFDAGDDSALFRGDIGDGTRRVEASQVKSTGFHYTYAFTHDGNLYNLVTRDNDIYLTISEDNGITWTTANSGLPVLTHDTDPNSNFYTLWNVGVDIDTGGVWHMLVESAKRGDGQSNVGLSYLTGTVRNGYISFDATKTQTQAIPNGGGNAFIKVMSDGGLLILHGMLKNYQGWAYVSITTYKNGVFTLHDDFKIYSDNIHIADPSAIDLPGGGSMITVSYDQKSAYAVYSGMSLENLYETFK